MSCTAPFLFNHIRNPHSFDIVPSLDITVGGTNDTLDSGIVADMLDDQLDMALQFALQTEVAHRRVHISAPAFHANMHVLYVIGGDHLEPTDFTDTFKNMNPKVAVYYVICFAIVCVIIASDWAARGYSFNVTTFFKSLEETVNLQLGSLLFQINKVPITWPSRLLWYCAIIASFVIINNYILNGMSVEQVARTPAPKIDQLSDLLEEPFNNIKVVLVKQLLFYDYVRTSSTLRGLFDRMSSDNDNCKRDIASCSLPEFDADLVYGYRYDSQLHKKVNLGKIVFLFPDIVFRVIKLQMILNVRKHNITGNVIKSKWPLAESIAFWFFRKQLPSEVKQFLDFRLRLINERGVFEKILFLYAQHFNQYCCGITNYNLTALLFVDPPPREVTEQTESPAETCTLDKYYGTLKFSFAGVILAVISLIAENLIMALFRKRNAKRRLFIRRNRIKPQT